MIGLGLVGGALAAPAYVVAFTHLESASPVDRDEALYDRQVDALQGAMDLFDGYGARLTVEAGDTFAKAEQTWGRGLLAGAVARGHGVGTHADYGKDITRWDKLATRMRASKQRIDALVGADANRGISGGTGPADWVRAAAAAGFDYVSGLTGYAYLSMPLSARPSGWTDSYIRTVAWHDPVPVDLARRVHPMRLGDARDFVDDAPGRLWVVAGGMGVLSSLGEQDYGCGAACGLDAADVDALDAAIGEALAARDPDRVAVVQVHVPLRLYTEEDRPLLEATLAAIGRRVDAGELQWAVGRDVWAAVAR